MKRYIYPVAAAIFLLGSTSCQKQFLQLPISNTTNVDSVFSTTTNALSAVSQAYFEALNQGIPYQGNWNSLIDDNLSGAMTFGLPWCWAEPFATSTGMNASAGGEDMDGWTYNYTAIRQCYLVKENIDLVKDMSASDKAVIKAEMQALVAYRYEQMFIMYGGVPLLDKSLEPTDNLNIPRAPLQQVLDSISSWCDQAAAALPSTWPATWTGRMTKAAALAVKAKALIYAARPLFNSASPYLPLGGNNNLICFGAVSANRWDSAAQACEAVIAEAQNNASLHIINTGNPLADYGTATSTPANPEIILAFKAEGSYASSMATFYNPHNWQAYESMLTTRQLENYYKADGTSQSWPSTTTILPFSDYLTRMNQMEPRFKADFWIWQSNAWNNPNDSYWDSTHVYQWVWDGAAVTVKFWYNAGTRSWFEFPIFRLAAFYLEAAEAYNEMGQPAQALAKLNVIHERAGLPAITTTDQTQLRALIQRESAIELFDENYWLHDEKHWKLADLANGLIGGPIREFTFNNGAGINYNNNQNYQDKVEYQGFWAPSQYLNPFPQTEINKGYLVQNPGY